jgi:hypothetical protein
MINEYLFLTDENREELVEFKPEGIAVEISTIKNTSLWIAAYSLVSNSEESAKKLSDVHSYIMKYSPLTLSCESSEHFNKALFPLANEFERKLRKLLYLSASISNSEQAKKTINDLESKTLGVIFESLFVDHSFVVNTKKRVNAQDEFKGKGNYTKAEILQYLSNLSENNLWGSLFLNDSMPTFRTSYNEIFDYRNNVMHAHNIDKKTYARARRLFEKVNSEFDVEIGNHIGQVEETPREVKKDVNHSISAALATANLSRGLEVFADAIGNLHIDTPSLDALRYAQESAKQYSEMLKIDPALLNTLRDTQESARRLSEMVKPDPVTQRRLEEIKNILRTPEMEHIREMQRQISNALIPFAEIQDKINQLTSGLTELTLPEKWDENDITEDGTDDVGGLDNEST